MITLSGDHLRSCVAWTSTGSLQHLVIFISVGKPEVNDLNIILVIEQEVLGLKISVANSYLVDILDSAYNLLEESAGLLLLESLPLDDVVEQLTSVGVLHDEEQLARSFNDFIQLDHVGVSNNLQNVDFPRHPLHVRLVLYLIFFQNLDGHFLAGDEVSAEPDFSEGALAK